MLDEDLDGPAEEDEDFDGPAEEEGTQPTVFNENLFDNADIPSSEEDDDDNDGDESSEDEPGSSNAQGTTANLERLKIWLCHVYCVIIKFDICLKIWIFKLE